MGLETTVTVHGQSYLVLGEGRDATVRAIIHPSPVSGYDAYQQGTVFRTLKSGSDLHKAAVKQAAYDRAMGKAR